jgi:hypothetical protein
MVHGTEGRAPRIAEVGRYRKLHGDDLIDAIRSTNDIPPQGVRASLRSVAFP